MKKRTASRALALVLVLLMLFGVVPVMNASAEETDDNSWDAKACYVVIDATGWEVDCLTLLIGGDGWTWAFPMSHTVGNCYKAYFPDITGASEWCVVNAAEYLTDQDASPSEVVEAYPCKTPMQTWGLDDEGNTLDINGDCFNECGDLTTVTIADIPGEGLTESGEYGHVLIDYYYFEDEIRTESTSETHPVKFVEPYRTTSTTLTAICSEGKVFEGWYTDLDGECYSTDPTISIDAYNVITRIYAVFGLPKSTLDITATRGGTVTGAGTYLTGEEVDISAIPDEGYEFSGWNVLSGDSPVDVKSKETTVTLTQDTFLEAEFKDKYYSVVFKDGDGTVLSRQSIKHGEDAVAPDVPSKDGHIFLGWDKEYTTVTSSLLVTARYTWEQQAGVIYFNASGWSATVPYILIGHSSWSSAYPMIYLTGNVYKCIIPNWKDATEWCIINAASGWSDEGTSPSHRKVYAYNSTDIKSGEISDTVMYTLNDTKPLRAAITASASCEDPATETYSTSPVGGIVKISGYDINGASITAADSTDVTAATGSVALDVLNTTTVTLIAVPRVGYVFAGWYDAAEGGKCLSLNTTYSFAANGDLKAYARFDAQTYTVTFVDWDSTVLKTDVVAHGTAATPPETPTREGFTFEKWNVDYSNITQNTTVKAVYAQDKVSITLTASEGGTVRAATNTCNPGSMVSIWATANQGYKFSHWVVESGNTPASLSTASTTVTVTEDTVIHAVFVSTRFTLTLEVSPEDAGTVSGAGSYNQGQSVNIRATNKVGYMFNKWVVVSGNAPTSLTSANTYVTVTQNTVLRAEFVLKTYTVTFKDHKGAIMKTQTVKHGDAAIAPDVPTIVGYTFTGWDKDFSNITSNLTVTAKFELNSYYVTFKDWNDVILKKQIIKYGSSATAPTAPTRVGYTFAGWDKSFSRITEDIVITALYNVNTYDVIFKDWDGTVLDTQEVEYCAAATAPAAPTRAGYDFVGWDKSFSKITGDIIVTAQYAPIANLNGNSITLFGDLGVNFYMDIPEEVMENEDVTVLFTYDDKEVEVPVSSGESTDYGQKFTCNIPAKNMLTEVTCSVKLAGSGQSATFKYTVKEYSESILANPRVYGDEAIALVKAMLNYGAAAQTYLGYNTDNLANESEYMSDEDRNVPEKDFSNLGYTLVEENPEEVKYYGASLNLKSEVGIRLYFTIADGVNVEDLAVTVDGILSTIKKNGNLYMVEIPDIAAHNLYKKYEVKVGSTEISYCVMDYAATAQKLNNQAALKIMYALDVFAQCAIDYKN